MKNYKNEYGTVYAVMLDKHNHPAIMASDPSDGWVVSGTLAPAVAAAEAKTHEELQTVLDTEAEKRGWVSCNLPGACDDAFANPTDAAAGATEPTETAAPASGDDVCNHCVCRECDDERCLQAHCDCRDKGMGCWKPDDDCRHDHPELFSSTDKIAAEEAPEEDHPAEPAEEKAEITTKTAAIAAPETALPVFDFGADASTNGVLAQCAQMFMAGRYAQFLAVKQAHDVTANHYQGSFGKFCEIIGISRDTGDRMVSVAANCGNIMIDGKPLIEIAQLSVLYAAAKPSAPAEAVEAVKAGDVTTMPEYKALLDQLARKDKAIRAAQEANEKNRVRANQAEDDYDAATQRAETAERRAREAEAQRKNLQEAEAAHAAKIRELESRPVDVAVRKPTDAEIERYRQEGYVKAQKEFAARRDDESDFCETIADHAEAVADSCAEALAGWFRLAADIDDAAYAAGAEHIKALWLALREALQSGAWPTDDLDDDDDDEEYDPDDDDEETGDE